MSNNMDRNIPKSYRNLYQFAVNSKSRKAKIRYFCLECCGFKPSEVRKCTDRGCVFYSVRLTG